MIRKEEITKAAVASFHSPDNTGFGYIAGFENGVEWADKTMIDKICDFIRLNAYKYRQLKFVKNKATFDFRTDRLIEDLRKQWRNKL